MRFQGNTTQYTGFALIAIESVWPNPSGNELLQDEYDLSLLGREKRVQSSTGRSQFRPNRDELSSVSREEDYEKVQGYYRILPLNVLGVKTNTSGTGSSFSVSFTLDDLVLVTKDVAPLLNAAGLPINSETLVEAQLEELLPILKSVKDSEGEEWSYIKDDDLGLSRYRVKGAASSFNVEDLVRPNDTVTIWLYHDPQDFYTKDGDAQVLDRDLNFNSNIQNVIGSGSRMNQFSSESTTFEGSLFHALGLINPYIEGAIRGVVAGEAASQAPAVTSENVAEVLNNFSQIGSTIGIDTSVADDYLMVYTETALASKDVTQDHAKAIYTNVIHRYLRPPIQEETIDGVVQETQTWRDRVMVYRSRLDTLMGNLEENDEGSFIPPSVSAYSDIFESQDELDDYVLYLTSFKNILNKKLEAYAESLNSSGSFSYSQQNFVNGRNVLSTHSHGETPYLALKGSISGVSVKVGAVGGTHIVTITGMGYEKILGESEVYIDDALLTNADAIVKNEYNTQYLYVTPPIGLLHLASRWAAKQVVFGPPSDYTKLANLEFMFLSSLFQESSDTINSANESLTKENELFDGNVVIRGLFLLAKYSEVPSEDNVRVFSPVSYFDLTRITEMIRVINASYQVPDTDAVVNVAVTIDPKRSIMDNMRKLGGEPRFYELFMDESGRLRYRLSFEAAERTPRPEYTPTIQDEDVLSGGATFSYDDSTVSTVVDVQPVLGKGATAMGGVGFVGRSAPRAAEIPLSDTGIPDSAVSPDLFRYGMRSLTIYDIYSSEIGGAAKKADLYRLFYEKPLKKATIKVRNSTSYRRGETVLVYLRTTKYRSKALIDIDKMLSWLNYLKANKDLREAYIGIDTRLLNKDSYGATRGEYDPIPSTQSVPLFSEYEKDPYSFVLDQFITTFTFLKSTLPGVNVITPEYFPSTYWFFSHKSGAFYAWDENRLDDNVVIDLYYSLLQATVLGSSVAAKALPKFFQNFPGIINAVQFQTFRATSYYIDAVSHVFQHGSEFTTSLNLNYGQDNLVLLDPKKSIPIGFLSLERKLRIGWDDDVQKSLWFSEGSTRSPLQNMYLNQLKEDTAFKKGSFLYNSQLFRNSANYMYDLAHREGLETGLSIRVEQSPEGGTGAVATPIPNSFPEEASGANDSRAIAYLIASEYENVSDEDIEVAAEKYGSDEDLLREYFEGL